ncbi:head-tail joining protein [Azospirillum endophyticum]
MIIDLDALLHSPVSQVWGRPAIYTPPSGTPVPCVAVLSEGDRDWRSGGSGVTTPARIAEVRVSEVAVMEIDGLLTVGADVFVIDKATQPDTDRLLWRLELK